MWKALKIYYYGGMSVGRISRKEKREKESKVYFFGEFLKVKNHFFKNLINMLKSVMDMRHQSYTVYGAEILLFTVLMKNICGIKSMTSMTNNFNKNECIENMAKVLGDEELEELPHYKTINDFLCKLDTGELDRIIHYMINQLFKKRCFEKYRLLNKYWRVAVDGTGLFSFHEKHCENCLKREHKDKDGNVISTTYHHSVLEAKLVVGDMVFSIGTEFIENEDENVSKQDCEINAFKRLAKTLKKRYPKLPICILGDSLYPSESVFKICDDNQWKFLLRFKEGKIKSLGEEFKALKQLDPNTNGNCVWVKDISYQERKVDMLETEVGDKNGKKTSFLFITSISITKRNADEIALAGRSRWKIENQGFNNQKNIRHDIEHANSLNYNAMKNHYLITQIADIIRQIFEKGLGIIKALNKGIKEISAMLLESFRTIKMTDADKQETNRMKTQFT